MRLLPWLSAGMVALAIAMSARYLLERHESAALRAEIALLVHENRKLAELRAEHARLIAASVSNADLERLRGDRAAISRLRAEINRLRESAERRARASQEPNRNQHSTVTLKLGIASDGTLSMNGTPVHFDALRQLLAGLARRSQPVEIRIRAAGTQPPGEHANVAMERLARLGNELGLTMRVRFENAGQ